jgi:hypothetical protein
MKALSHSPFSAETIHHRQVFAVDITSALLRP